MTSPTASSQPGDRLPWDALQQDPTPDEIRRACQEIQAGWSEQERRYRATVYRPWELDEREGTCYFTRA